MTQPGNKGNAASTLARVMVEGEADDSQAAEVFRHLRESGREPGTLHRVLASTPAILAAHYRLAMTLRHECSLDRRFSELAILRTTQLEGGAYPFAAHLRHARAAGVTEDQIANVGNWATCGAFDAVEKAVLAYVDALAERRTVPDDIFVGISDHLAPSQIVELTAIVGFYVSAARLSCGLAMRHAQ